MQVQDNWKLSGWKAPGTLAEEQAKAKTRLDARTEREARFANLTEGELKAVLVASVTDTVRIVGESGIAHFEPEDMERLIELNGEFIPVHVLAQNYALQYTGNFDFMLEMHDAAVQRIISEGQAKGVLNCMLAEYRRSNKAAAPKPQFVTEAGMYQTPEGDIYKVQMAVHGSGNLYAKRLVAPEEFGGKAGFVYEQGAIKKLTSDMRMSLEQAKAFGALYGTCCVCGRTLTDEKSIEAGIGPVCGGRL